MNRTVLLIPALMLVIVALPIMASASSEVDTEEGFVYHDQIFHYSLEIPAGWKRIPVKEFQYFIAEYKKILSEKAAESADHVEVGFYQEGKNYFEYPYILVFNYKMEFRPFDEIVEEFYEADIHAVSEEIDNEMGELLQDIKLDKPIIDKRRNTILLKMRGKGEGNVQLVTFMAICYGNARKVQINFCTLDSQYLTYLPTFYSTYKSFEFDSGYACEDFPGITNRYVRKILDSALIPILLSVTVLLLTMYFRKKRSDRLKKKKELSEGHEEK